MRGDIVPILLHYFSLLLVFSFVITSMGCANRQIVATGFPDDYMTPERLMQSAAQREKKGDLHEALIEFRIAATLSSGSSRPVREAERLEKLIEEKTAKLMTIAEKRYKKGKLESAEALYLSILSLDPKHKPAFNKLREINEKRLQKRMEQKVALSQRYRKSSRRKKSRDSEDEGYIYSRQAILQAEDRAKQVSSYIGELEKHITKYPNDTELKVMLLNVRVVQARAAFDDSNYDLSLQHLAAAELLLSNDEELLKKLTETRKALGKELYLKGVRSARSEPLIALELWRTGLKFDPHDKRTQLRIDTFENR